MVFFSHTNTVFVPTSFAYKILNGVHVWLTPIKALFRADIVKKIDQKIDDGLFQSGELRGGCSQAGEDRDYDYAINNKLRCAEIEYRVFVF